MPQKRLYVALNSTLADSARLLPYFAKHAAGIVLTPALVIGQSCKPLTSMARMHDLRVILDGRLDDFCSCLAQLKEQLTQSIVVHGITIHHCCSPATIAQFAEELPKVEPILYLGHDRTLLDTSAEFIRSVMCRYDALPEGRTQFTRYIYNPDLADLERLDPSDRVILDATSLHPTTVATVAARLGH